MNLCDRLTLDGTRRTADGYLTATAKIARTGIQEYRGDELGRDDMEIVRVYRPPDEVFDADAMKSMAHRPITDNHPDVPVSASTWRDLAVGQIGGEIDGTDGKFISVPLVLMDAETISKVEAGKRELSVGYSCDIEWESGVTPDGLPYDAVQRTIRANHLAVVDAARGGPELKIGDTDMTTRKITVDGMELEVADASASILNKLIADKDAKIADLNGQIETATDAAAKSKTDIEAKDAEIATLKSQLDEASDPAKLDAAVKDRAEVVDKAKKIIGDKLVIDGKSVADMRKQVVAAKLGDAAKDWTDEQIAASFGTLAAAVDAKPNDPIRTAFQTADNTGDDPRVAAYAARDKRIKDAWKGTSEQAH